MADISKEMAVQLAREVGATPYTNRHYPDRPTHTFNVEQLEAFANKLAKLGRNAGLEEAKQVAKETCSHDATLFGDGFNTAALVIERAIESLKDNTP